MGVEAYLQPAGQLCRFAQQLYGYAEGRTGSQSYLMHGIRVRVMELLYGLFAVGEDFIHGLNHAVRRKPSILYA